MRLFFSIFYFLIISVSITIAENGYVVRVDQTTRTPKIYIDLGYQNGIRKGMNFSISRNGSEVAQIEIDKTFDFISVGKSLAEFLGVEIEVGDRIEILITGSISTPQTTKTSSKTETKITPSKTSETKTTPSESIAISPDETQKPPKKKRRFDWKKWLALSTGIGTGVMAVRNYRSSWKNFRDYETEEDPEVKKKGESQLTQFYIYTGVSSVFLTYSGFKILFNTQFSRTSAGSISIGIYRSF